jgi:repressor LexA
MKNNILSTKEIEALRHIRNSIMHKGRAPSIRELMKCMGYRSPRSISLIIENLIEKGVVQRASDNRLRLIKNFEHDSTHAHTVEVPLIGTITCGMPIYAEEHFEAMIPVSIKLAKPPHKYFLLRARGDSMNEKGINDGDIVLVRQQPTANNGDIVVALIDDEATIKEYHYVGESVVLRPRSTNRDNQPIILTRDFQVQGVVIRSIPTSEKK